MTPPPKQLQRSVTTSTPNGHSARSTRKRTTQLWAKRLITRNRQTTRLRVLQRCLDACL